jgi:hypothetical protein
MPRETSRETANLIKKRIKGLNLFIILATTNAMNSKWVPWEIGVADSVKDHSNIGLVPIADPLGQFHGSEYLSLYQTIRISDKDNLVIFSPGEDRGRFLSSWIKSSFK